MAMFPTLSRAPDLSSCGVGRYEDNVIRFQPEDGPETTRARTTEPDQVFPLAFSLMTTTDYDTLNTFYLANRGQSFTWTNTKLSQDFTMRFLEPPDITDHPGRGDLLNIRVLLKGHLRRYGEGVYGEGVLPGG